MGCSVPTTLTRRIALVGILVVAACSSPIRDVRTIEPVPAPTPAPPSIAVPRCGTDQWHESICGAVPVSQSCGPRGDSLTSFGANYTIGWYAAPIDRGTFSFDRAATAAYWTSLANERVPHDSYCCYSRCTQLVVAPVAPPPRIPPNHEIEDRCVPPPPSTAYPADADPSCPAAVDLTGVLLPYRASTNVASGQPAWFPQYTTRSCCYSAVVPIQRPRNRSPGNTDREP